MRTPTRLLCAALLALALGAGACADDDTADDKADEPATDDTVEPAETGDWGIIQLSALADDSPYVQGLCSIDFFHPGDQDDPLAWTIDELRGLPADTRDEADEVTWMIERLERVAALEDPSETDDLPAVAAVLRARCS